MHEQIDPEVAASTGSPRLFQNALLDKLSRIHHLVPPSVYLPIALASLIISLRLISWPIAILAFLAGYAAWTLVEYFGHRFVFHLNLPSPAGKRLHYLIHGVHHEHPGDPLRLVMPLPLSIPIMATAFVVIRLILGAAFAPAVWSGFIVGYVGYDMVHFYVHHAQPRSRVGQMLRRRHLLHHFRDSTYWFGVSAIWWDDVFGTKPKVVRKPD